MRKFLKRNGLVMVLSTALVVSLAGNVVGAEALTEIQAYLNAGIRVVLHGQAFEPIEPTDGTRMVPITYKGRTYLPLRAVAEAVGLKVNYDANTNTAYLGDVAGDIGKTISFIAASPEHVFTDLTYALKSRNPELLTYGDGKGFDTGYVVKEGPGYVAGLYARFATNYEYDKFKATLWVADSTAGAGDQGTITFTDEHDILVKEFKVPYGQAFEVELAIKDVAELEIYVEGDSSIIGNPMLGR